MTRRYQIIRTYGLDVYTPVVGTILEEWRGHDYGLTRDNARGYGEECVALATGLPSPLFIVVPLSTVELVV